MYNTSYIPILIAPIVALLLGAISTTTAFADTGNSLPSTEQILQDANSPQVQSQIQQEAPQVGESTDQATNNVVNFVESQCMSNPQGCISVAHSVLGALAGAATTLIGMLW